VTRFGADDEYVGSELAGYRIEALLGRGGMGAVYLAEQLRLKRKVALKLLSAVLAQTHEFRERFLRESELAASLDHANVVPIYDAGEAGDLLYLAMRYVDGVDLGKLLAHEQALEPDRAVKIAGQVANALDAAHARSLVHRDVKPANVLVTEADHVYLTDFGLTKTLGLESLTRTGQFLGTPAYAAPEQISGQPVGAAADVYSFGCLLYECLVGEPPFPRDTDLAVLWAHVQDEPSPASERRPELSAGLDDVLARTLAKEPAARYRTCGEVVAAARNALEHPSAVPGARLPAEVRKTVAVLVATVSPSSAAGGRLDPESLRRAASRCLADIGAVIERHGGVFERLAGDSVIAVFGFPVAREDDTIRAVAAAEELRSGNRRLRDELEAHTGVRTVLRVAVETGEIVAASPTPAAAEVSGAPVHVASRLGQRAGPDEILLGEDAYSLVRASVAAEPLALADADALEATRAWRLDRILSEPLAVSRPFATPLVGRERELSALRRTFDDAVARRSCRLVTLLGPPGIGKTRLARAFATSVEGEATVLAGRCLSYGEGITYWPIAEMLRPVLGDEPASTLATILADEEDGDLVAARVASAIGLTEMEGVREETFWALRRLFESLDRDPPLVLVLEDIHWAEPTLLDLLEHVARFSREAAILLACLSRRELLDERPEWCADAHDLRLEIGPLADHEIATLLADAADLPDELATRIAATAEGNPLFAEQLLALALEHPQEAARLSLPPAIQALLAARLDRLSLEERRVIECASIEGQVFHVDPLAELCPEVAEPMLGRCLLALTRKELVRPDRPDRPGDEALRFGHVLIREAAYQAVPKERRAILHERFAGFLERAGGGRLVDEEEFIGYHLEQAFRYRAELGLDGTAQRELGERSAGRLAAAGRRALARGDPPAATNLIERAASILPDDRPERISLLSELGLALTEAGRLAQAEEVLEEAQQRARLAGDEHLEAQALLHRLALRLQTQTDAAVEEIRRSGAALGRVFERVGDELGQCRFRRLEGLVRWLEGQTAAADDTWKVAEALARRAGAGRELADILSWRASAAFFGSTPVPEAILVCEEIRTLLADNRHAQAWVLQPLAGLYAMAGELMRARELLARSNATLDELGLAIFENAAYYEGFVAMLGGNPAEAERCLRRSYAALEEMGEKALLADAAISLAEALYLQDRDDEAERFSAIASELSGREDVAAQCTWRAIRAKALARRGNLDEAELLARESVDLAERTDFLNEQGEALMSLAEVAQYAGRPDEVSRATLEAIERFERKGNVVAAASARAQLARTAAD
jgi:predicted ATPase/class 3 adenylate cyclase/predicted Ser/Thr protein kinase